EAVPAQRGEKRRSAPMTERYPGEDALAASAAPLRRRHVGLRPGVVDEDEAVHVEAALLVEPGGATGAHGGAVELSRADRVAVMRARVLSISWRSLPPRPKSRRLEP